MEIPFGLTVRGLLKKDNKFLILKRHLNSSSNPNRWELPGGKVDDGENFDKALIRELKEETNLDIKIGDLVGAVQEDFPHKKTVAIIMNIELISGEVKISKEHVDWKWVSIDELESFDISGWFKTFLNDNNKNYSYFKN